jgi:hypothetical protein
VSLGVADHRERADDQQLAQTAEYHVGLADNVSAQQVRDHAKRIADGVKAGAWVLAVRASDWALQTVVNPK